MQVQFSVMLNFIVINEIIVSWLKLGSSLTVHRHFGPVNHNMLAVNFCQI